MDETCSLHTHFSNCEAVKKFFIICKSDNAHTCPNTVAGSFHSNSFRLHSYDRLSKTWYSKRLISIPATGINAEIVDHQRETRRKTHLPRFPWIKTETTKVSFYFQDFVAIASFQELHSPESVVILKSFKIYFFLNN